MAKQESCTHFVWDQCKLVVCSHNRFFVSLIGAVLVFPFLCSHLSFGFCSLFPYIYYSCESNELVETIEATSFALVQKLDDQPIVRDW